MFSRAYTLAAYIHHNFQSDIRKVSRTIFENAPFEVLFCYVNQGFQPVRFLRYFKYGKFYKVRIFQ